MTPIEEVEDQLNHSKICLNTLKADQQKISNDIRYYEGQYDALNTVLSELKKMKPS